MLAQRDELALDANMMQAEHAQKPKMKKAKKQYRLRNNEHQP
jgi:hypothetical protein